VSNVQIPNTPHPVTPCPDPLSTPAAWNVGRNSGTDLNSPEKNSDDLAIPTVATIRGPPRLYPSDLVSDGYMYNVNESRVEQEHAAEAEPARRLAAGLTSSSQDSRGQLPPFTDVAQPTQLGRISLPPCRELVSNVAALSRPNGSARHSNRLSTLTSPLNTPSTRCQTSSPLLYSSQSHTLAGHQFLSCVDFDRHRSLSYLPDGSCTNLVGQVIWPSPSTGRNLCFTHPAEPAPTSLHTIGARSQPGREVERASVCRRQRLEGTRSAPQPYTRSLRSTPRPRQERTFEELTSYIEAHFDLFPEFQGGYFRCNSDREVALEKARKRFVTTHPMTLARDSPFLQA
jgi:hypothetical protein